VRVLGIDPGSRVVGYGWIEIDSGTCEKADFGEIRISTNGSFPQRLKQIHDSVADLIERIRPDAVSIEETYVTSNAKTTLRLGHARGVILLAAVERGVPIAEYAPREIKLAVLGSGGAGKGQVVWMVCQLLKLDPSKVSEDAADALAAALCHGFRSGNAIDRLSMKS
jgi:crossover junction endodeoxyribonuclease RuvC